MLNITTLREATYDYLASVCTAGTPIIRYDTNAVQPVAVGGTPTPNMYITFLLTTFKKVNDDHITQPSSAEAIKIYGTREFIMSLEGYGPGAIAELDKIRSSIEVPNNRDALRAKGIIVFRFGDILDLSEVYESRFHERGSLELSCRTSYSTTSTRAKVSSAVITKTYKLGSSVVKTGTITVP
jgi:hypothetical protein